MSEVRWSISQNSDASGLSNVVAFFPNKQDPIRQATSNHPYWSSIIDGLRNEADVYDLFDVRKGLYSHLKNLSDRVSFDGDTIYFDGDPQVGPLAEHIKRCLESGVSDYKPVVKFWEKVAQNPDKRSREQLFEWLRSHEFTITTDGDILGYKGVRATHGWGGDGYQSISSGTAFVDGVRHTGQIPNNPGTVVTMPRSEVENDPRVACHVGLHVGDWSYASSFGSVVLEVHVNPRDVVSIPVDNSYRKMRCCRYKVISTRDAQSHDPIHFEKDRWDDVGYEYQ